MDSPDNTKLLSFAALTDEPPAEVAAAGHDRMIVNLKPESLEAWLTPAVRADADLQRLLENRQQQHYEYEIEAA